MTMDFYIFRHGESTYNVAGRTQGRTNDSQLTDLGKKQALEIGRRLADKQIEIIVTSPLARAMQTAELANQTLNVPIEIDEHFIEVDVGEVEGWPREEIKAKYGDLFVQWHTHDFDTICYPGGETRKQVRQRVFVGLENWAANQQYRHIAVSSHGIMLGQVLIALGDRDPGDIRNGAILHIRKQKDQWEIIEWI